MEVRLGLLLLGTYRFLWMRVRRPRLLLCSRFVGCSQKIEDVYGVGTEDEDEDNADEDSPVDSSSSNLVI